MVIQIREEQFEKDSLRACPKTVPNYGFVSHIEIIEGQDLWLVELELLDSQWFDKVWKVFKGGYGKDLEALLGGRPFADVYSNLDDRKKELVYWLHVAYHLRTLQQGDPAPVALMQWMLHSGHSGRKLIEEGKWYRVELPEGEAVDPPRGAESDGEAVYASLGFDSTKDGSLRSGLPAVEMLDPTLLGVLHALYFPQIPPNATVPNG